jgi:hypothetical protein
MPLAATDKSQCSLQYGILQATAHLSSRKAQNRLDPEGKEISPEGQITEHPPSVYT